MAEAYTKIGSSKVSDLGFSYTKRGEVSDAYESAPGSGGYYHIGAAYWDPPGLLKTLPTWTYNRDGEGRVYSVNASSGQNPI